jgi:hypothetical protein
MTLLDKVIESHRSHEERMSELSLPFKQQIIAYIQSEIARQLPLALQRAIEVGVDPRIYK